MNPPPKPDKATVMLGVAWLWLAAVGWRVGQWINRKRNRGEAK